MKSNKINGCIDPQVGELITQYELGQLSDEERDRFEEHLMDCDFCRRELEEMLPTISAMRRYKTAIIQGLHDEGISFESLRERLLGLHHTEQVKRASLGYLWQKVLHGFRRFGKPRIFVPAAVVVTASLLFVALLHHPENPYLPYLSFEKLPYRPQKLRGEMATEAERLFHEGMNNYLKNNYKSAIGNLKNAIEKDPDNGSWWLYLGVCYYLDHQGKQAIEALTGADTMTQHSLKIRSRWYLAQAYLLQGDTDRAIPLLEWIMGQRREYAAQAGSLLTITLPLIKGERKH